MRSIINEIPAPRVFISQRAKERLDAYVKYCEYEISGLGRIFQSRNDFFIDEVYIFEQEVTSASTVLSQKKLAKYIFEMVSRGEDTESLKLWWHSHADMSVFWSTTDQETISNFHNGWMLSLVVNKNRDYRLRLDIYEPLRLTLDNLKMEVIFPENRKIVEEVVQEIGSKVKVAPIPIISKIGGIGVGVKKGLFRNEEHEE